MIFVGHIYLWLFVAEMDKPFWKIDIYTRLWREINKNDEMTTERTKEKKKKKKADEIKPQEKPRRKESRWPACWSIKFDCSADRTGRLSCHPGARSNGIEKCF